MEIDTSAIHDFLPIPDTMAPLTDPDKTESAASLTEKPTSSHALAMADHDAKGAAQEEHGQEVKDLGWTADNANIANPLVGHLPNEDLWVLVRRFNKVSQKLYRSYRFLLLATFIGRTNDHELEKMDQRDVRDCADNL